MINMNEVIANVTLTKVCSIRADEDSKDKKSISLKVKFDGATIQSVFSKALAGTVIQWQNGVGRKNFDKYKNMQVVEVQFTAPASQGAIDPESAMVALLAGMTPEQQKAKIEDMVRKACHLPETDEEVAIAEQALRQATIQDQAALRNKR
jgi:hypothetical protein